MLQIVDTETHRTIAPCDFKYFAQCASNRDFGSLLYFAAQVLFFVDADHDGRILPRVAQNAICESVWLDDFNRWVGRIANLLKAPPEFLAIPQSYTVAVKIYDGWIDTPQTRYNLRTTLVWESGDNFIALHTRQCI